MAEKNDGGPSREVEDSVRRFRRASTGLAALLGRMRRRPSRGIVYSDLASVWMTRDLLFGVRWRRRRDGASRLEVRLTWLTLLFLLRF